MGEFTFGIISEISLVRGTISFVIFAIFLSLLGYITSAAEYLEDYYQCAYRMIQKLYEELMVIGIINFTIVMLKASGFLDDVEVWIIAVEFADILFFITALFLIIHAGFLIVQAVRLDVQYARDHHKHYREIIEEIRQNTSFFGQLLYKYRYFPGTELRRRVEFKIIHSLFKDTYHLPSSFDFATYLKSYHEKYAVELVDLGASNWCILLLFVAVNFIVVKFSPVANPCFLSEDFMDFNITLSSGSERRLNSHEQSLRLGHQHQRCNDLMLNYFVLAAFVMWTFCFGLLLFTRFCEIRQLSKTGVRLVGDYELILRKLAEDEERLLKKARF